MRSWRSGAGTVRSGAVPLLPTSQVVRFPDVSQNGLPPLTEVGQKTCSKYYTSRYLTKGAERWRVYGSRVVQDSGVRVQWVWGDG